MSQPQTAKDWACRALNFAVAVILLLLVAPLMGAIALLVKVSSPGPVIYKQPRVGIDRRQARTQPGGYRRNMDMGGRIFTIYKFRTMRASGGGRQVWATENDPRITPIGRALRACRLDELPQLFNVLRGDMNIVGPRPEQPQIFAELREKVDRYRVRQQVLPGITGLAQVTLPYDADINDVRNKVNLDLTYIRRRSVAQDLSIMAKTVPVMVFQRGSR